MDMWYITFFAWNVLSFLFKNVFFWKNLSAAVVSSRPNTEESKIVHLTIVGQHSEHATLSEQKTEKEKEKIGKEKEKRKHYRKWLWEKEEGGEKRERERDKGKEREVHDSFVHRDEAVA